MSHDDDLDSFQEIMGDVKRIDHDTEHQKCIELPSLNLQSVRRLCGCLRMKKITSLDYSPMLKLR